MTTGRVIAAQAAWLMLVVGSCTEDVQLESDGDDGIPGLVSLEVTPAATSVVLFDISETPRQIAFTATGGFVDGSSRDVTAEVSWAADRRIQGGFTAPGEYTTSNAAAGVVTVRARSGDLIANATLTVEISQTVIDPAFPPPPGTAGLFGADATVIVDDARRSPAVLYPSHQTMFPPNLSPPLLQYQQGADNQVWRLTFESELLHLTVLTGSDRWQPDAAVWRLLAWSNAGGRTIMTVSAANPIEPALVHASAPIELSFAPDTVSGTLYFRAVDAGGVFAARLDRVSAAPFYPAEPDGTCVGCHAASRDGERFAAGYGGEILQVVEVPSLDVLISASDQRKMGWATFSPDGALVLVADKGVLTLHDAGTGAPVGADGGIVPLPAGVLATHPDWSPAGDFVAVALGSTVSNRDVKGGAIARIAYTEGSWGEPEILVPSTGDNDNNVFPRYAPDGSVIAYVHADSPSRTAATAELRLVPAVGGAPINLQVASHRVGLVDDVPELGSSMPTWAPGTDGLSWLAFASTRSYGHVLPTGDTGRIWVTAVDLDRVASGADPSYAAFWLPSQDPTQMNYAPVWASDSTIP